MSLEIKIAKCVAAAGAIALLAGSVYEVGYTRGKNSNIRKFNEKFSKEAKVSVENAFKRNNPDCNDYDFNLINRVFSNPEHPKTFVPAAEREL